MPLSERLLSVLADADAQLAAAIADTQTARNNATIAAGQRDTLAAQVAELTARIAELEAQVRPAPTRTTLFGADVDGTSLAAQQTKVAKWGQPLAVRQFFIHFTEVAPRAEGVGRIHASWKPGGKRPASTQAVLDAITDTAVRAACVNLKPGDVVEVWHEGDKKVRDGILASVADVIKIKNAFYDAAKRVRPDLLIANTLTGWEADPKNTVTRGNIDKWAAVKADLLGLDCDGVHNWPYPNYDDEPQTAVAFLAKFPDYRGWCVPEFGTSRQAADVDGSVRAVWAYDYAIDFESAGALYVCLYEYASTTGNAFTTADELAAWRALI